VTYHVVFSDQALKDLKKLDKHTSMMILGWIRKNLEGCSDPRQKGKGLTANRSGQWRYRIGDFRLLTEIQEDKIVILVLNVGHRRDIYKMQG
jgi:Cytotoxic translational repressor of toxin-antitoxin stability system